MTSTEYFPGEKGKWLVMEAPTDMQLKMAKNK